MIDRVNNLIQGQNQLQNDRRSNGPESARRGGEQAPAGRPEEDRVSLSESSLQMQALEQRVADSSGVDQQRIAELREAIERGDYEISAEGIADALIRENREL
ncbi:flagellar biosynthesis anti-sigma factor FlgM [Natronospira bacteriovora]|uniref:Negative regulator of flagellin synthesis n=1 Tax=Natronospira bacteriovora TaxID=3069753 RepID=A0ABU0W3B2_9GAMM|nr:flagellar biosynthesis anti-sigma factor FlgM [Natronospira sp. AB-CW4]MDQ2068497.1 flagellar biosynthesis anti-sigma factor FlgM [Natronospira sp. AB-CW4]